MCFKTASFDFAVARIGHYATEIYAMTVMPPRIRLQGITYGGVVSCPLCFTFEKAISLLSVNL